MTGFERFRRKSLVSRARLAELLGVTTTAVGNWENKKCIPPAHTLKRLAGIYNVTIDELLRTDYPDNDLSLERQENEGAVYTA